MSLEQDITELTKTASGLIDSFQQKEQAIEQKIADILPDSADGLNDFTTVEFFVDAVEGDDNNNGLSPDAPFKTVDAISGSVPHIGVLKISLKRDQRHLFSGVTGMLIGHVTVGAYGGDGEADPILQCLPIESSSGDPIIIGIVLKMGIFYFNNVVLDCSYSGAQVLNRDSGIVGYNQGEITVFLYDTKVLLNGHPLTAAFAGFRGVHLNMVGSEVNRGGTTENHMLIKSKSNSDPVILLNLTSSTFTGSTTDVAALLPTNASRTNIYANVDI